MGTRNQAQRRGARLSHPVLALLIAAVAAIGAISQCGLLLDAATASSSADGVSDRAMSRTAVSSAERPRVAAAQSTAPSPDATRPN